MKGAIIITKTEKVIEACEKVLDGLECETISVSSALLQCLRIARLSNDEDATQWLQYENGGYPTDNSGYILKNAWEIGCQKGRKYIKDETEYIFTDLVSELEESIKSKQNAINNFSTTGTSVSGDYALVAMNNLTSSVAKNTGTLIRQIEDSNKKLAILKGQYYDYALRKYAELTFGNVANDIFTKYRELVENKFSDLSDDTIIKLKALEDKINSDNSEEYSQALTTCRRLFDNVAKSLFEKYYPNYNQKTYKTKSGKEIDISGDHYLNKLSAVIELLQDKSPSKSLAGSSILYTIDWIENLNNLQCKGVHSEITKQDAMQCIIHTYICLGDILNLQ